MRYPKWNSYCTLKRKDDGIEVTNHFIEESYVLPTEIVRFGKRLDGKTEPYSIDKTLSRPTVRRWLKILDDYDCTRENRALLKTTSSFLLGLFFPNKIKPGMRVFAWFYNKLLQISFLPMLVFGAYYFALHMYTGEGGMFMGVILGLVFGMLLHEISHAFAALACHKGNLFEIGVGISYFVIPTGYALIDVTRVKSRFQRVQVNLAGIEANFFLCGLFLFLAGLCGSAFWEIFLGAALQNGLLGFLNLVFGNGIDGAFAMGELLGDNTYNFISNSRQIIFNRKKRHKILSSGIDGLAIFFIAFIFQLLQLTIPAFFIWNIIYNIEVFLQ